MEPQEQEETRNPDGTFKPGFSGNPGGRPRGSFSVINRLIHRWIENPEDFDAFVDEVRADPAMRKPIVEQLDGKPHQTTDVTSGGEKLPTPIYGGISIPGHDSNA